MTQENQDYDLKDNLTTQPDGTVSDREKSEESDNEIEGVLEKVAELDPDSAHKIERYIAIQQISHRGPMPSPQDLKSYSLVQHNLPERMMVMAEKSLASKSSHHDKLLSLKDKELDIRAVELKNEDNAHKREITSQNLSLVLAFIALLVCIIGSFYLAINGHKELALLLGGSTVVAVVGSFLSSRLKKK